MKVIEEKHEVHSSGDLIEVTASIKATSKAFHVLSSNLYSDKILAIVRELSCNAWDSHVSAGKHDLPIDIHLPTYADPTFYVRDFGLGMSDLDIRGGYINKETGEKLCHEDGRDKPGFEFFPGIYTTFFDSTKTDTNDVIGQLGLGSKSPYAYASTFTVESRFNGEKRLYTCYKNERNEPSITLMAVTETDESNGMTISLAVKVADIDKFSTAARKALMYFKPRPNIMGQTHIIPYTLEHTLSGSNWKLRNSDYYAHMKGAYVVQGFVPYPIDADQLEQTGLRGAAALVAHIDVDLYVPIGQVEVAPSREALSYDQRTIKNLIEQLERAAEEMRTSIQAEFDKCNNMWEAATLFDRLDNSANEKQKQLFQKLHMSKPFEWEGEPVTRHVKVDLETVTRTTIIRAKKKDQRGDPKLKIDGQWFPHNSDKFEFDLYSNTIVLIDTKHSGTNGKIADYLCTIPKKDNRIASVIILRPAAKGWDITEDVKKIVFELGGPPTINVEDLPDRPRAQRVYVASARKRKSAGLYHIWAGFKEKQSGRSWRKIRETIRKFSRSTWNLEEVDLDKGGYYTLVDNHVVMKPGGGTDFYFDQLLAHARVLGCFPTDTQVVGFTQKELQDIDLTKWHNVHTYVKDTFEKNYIHSKVMTAAKAASELRSYISRSFEGYFIKDSVLNRLPDGEFKTLLLEMRELLNAKPLASPSNADALRSMLGRELEIDGRATQYAHRLRNMKTRYKYLGLIEWSNVNEHHVDLVIDYVNEVDKVEENCAVA